MSQEEKRVNLALAELFMDQCIGNHPGQMANIDNNPVIRSICVAGGVFNVGFGNHQKGFALFLKEVSDELLKNSK